MKPDPDGWDVGPSESRNHHSHAQDPLLGIHQHLVDISRLACQSNDELTRYQSCYEQAYRSEHQKLPEMIAAYNALAGEKQGLEEENRYLKRQLMPQYERVLKRQEQEIKEMQIHSKSLEAVIQDMQKMSGEEQQKHVKAIETATNSLRTQSRRIKALEKKIQKNLNPPQALSVSPLRRSSRLGGEASMQTPTRTLTTQKSNQTKAKTKAYGNSIVGNG